MKGKEPKLTHRWSVVSLSCTTEPLLGTSISNCSSVDKESSRALRAEPCIAFSLAAAGDRLHSAMPRRPPLIEEQVPTSGCA